MLDTEQRARRTASQARWRDRMRAAGTPARHTGSSGKSGKGGKHKSLFEAGHFVAVDGEGFNRGHEIVRVIGAYQREYRTREHEYALLSASDGTELYNPAGRLTTKQCLDFLLAIKTTDPMAIVVCFGGSYDMCHMLAFGLERWAIEALLHGDGTLGGRKYVDVSLSDADVTHDYRIELRNRKSLSVWRWPAGADKHEQHRKKDGTSVWRMTKCDKVVLWDAWGFFQGTFAGAMKTWMHGDPDYDYIVKMKGDRNIFDRSEIAEIRHYNQLECQILARMMDKVREAIRAMGLTISRWDGVGAISGAILKAHGIKEHMAVSPPDVFDAACVAYSGGHIEAFKVGHHIGEVHHYDINSAYPAQFIALPSLSRGRWISGSGDQSVPLGFTLVHLEYRFKPGAPFYPLFYRQPNGSILYPERGAGWYWFPEYEIARQFAERFRAIEFRVLGWHHFRPDDATRPFSFITAMFEQRKAIIEETVRTGIPNGAQHTLKLGYNGVYGKTAQQIGVRIQDGEPVPPAYFQIEWAGYVTAGCRAQLMAAAMQKPHAIISLATDGIYATEPLDLDCPKSKILGKWEYKIHTGMTMVMPGVYWLHDGEKQEHYSRGFDKKTMQDSDFIHQAWARKKDYIEVPSRRMMTLGTALMSDNFWELRGLFTETVRELKLNGDNSKRYPVAMHNVKLHKSFVDTHPQDLMEDYDLPLTNLGSLPYPITWLKPEDAPETQEIAEITDADRSFYFDREAMILA